ncbi:MAG: DNA topoisomerase-1 [Flavobacteriaceae bacterium]|jgi:DNA topoisomerase-1|uniref:type I DNA topoisomerase n=1 Tax=Candidatus Marifrigoribacter sp. Uisw_064 TaxID=3230970 RepID=UPI003AE017E9
MAKNLVIVESPAKAKTIEKFLGKDFKVTSSFGHISDLPSKELGVDVDGDFTPKYIIPSEKKSLVKDLKALSSKAEMIWLASDEDREGEAIAWHLSETLELDESNTKRIVFHEITKTAILHAIENPRKINYDLVDAQQARRVLDRLVGYELSPVLWRKVKGGLSAGRVQSVAVRLIVERERQIEAFTPVASFRVIAEFTSKEGNSFKAKLPKNFTTESEAHDFLRKNLQANYKISNLLKKPAKKSPAAPFTTSTLQQEASRKLYFSVGKTMTVAQRLYEAGFITYMRTDSVNLSNDAKAAAVEAITDNYGKEYSNPRDYKGKSKGAQEAHEAIRPTDLSRQTISGDYDQERLYNLIWKRTIASQMSDAQIERTNVKIDIHSTESVSEQFVANGEMIKFDGFLKVYLEGTDLEDEEQEGMLPKLTVGDSLQKNYITATQRFSRPPYRFTEASLVKQMEELGIGRPSTYAPTISTIINRNYVEKGTIEGVERKYIQLVLEDEIKVNNLTEVIGSDKGKLVPTDIGLIVCDFLVEHFSTILDYNFTAKVEQDFDDIAEGKSSWKAMMKDFYKDFHPQVENVTENADRESGERILGNDPVSGKVVLVRLGRYGAMAQIGSPEDEEKKFASLRPDQQLHQITFEEVMDLFKLPKSLGTYDEFEIEVNNGRFGPYVKYDKKFISLPKGMDPLEVDMDMAIELIEEKKKADAPIYIYEDLPVQKGTGRFGPFIKWNNMFINVNKKYDFESLSDADIIELIETKKQKEIDKLIHDWSEEGIRLEKARWGRFNLIKGKTKVELPKTTKAEKMTLEQALEILEKNAPKKKTRKKATAKKK